MNIIGEKSKTATNYIKMMAYIKDYQLVAKKQGVKWFLPFSSPVLPDPPFSLFEKGTACWVQAGKRYGAKCGDDKRNTDGDRQKECSYFLEGKAKTNTLCIKVTVEAKDYQPVVKNEGAKGIPPFSSPVLPFGWFRVVFHQKRVPFMQEKNKFA